MEERRFYFGSFHLHVNSKTNPLLKEGGIGIFGFAVLAIFKMGFCAKKLRFFGFGVRRGLRIFRILALGFRFSLKILTGFLI